MTLVDRIKETAKKLDMNLQDVAKAAGIATNSIYGWKNVTPAADKLKAVADVLHVSVDYLLGNTDDPNPKVSTKPTDLADKDIVLSFEGKQIPPEDLETIRRFLRGGKDE